MYYLRANEHQQGPFSLAELREMARAGAFTPKSLVWQTREGAGIWAAALQVPELAEMFHAFEVEAIRTAEAEAGEFRRKYGPGERRAPVTIAIGSGKGGVGKTALTASLGLCLTALGQTVILVDGDLGGANLGPALGLPNSPKSSLDFFIRHKASVQDLLTPTGVDGLQLISGQAGVLGLANPRYAQKLKFINQLKRLEADFVLLDLGAGAMYDILDFFLSCDRGLLVTCPTPLAVKYTFGFLKAATYRGISRACLDDPAVREGLKRLAAHGFQPTMYEFLSSLEAESPSSAERVRHHLNGRSRGLILNMVMDRKELADAARIIIDASRKLGVAMDFLGYLPFDPAVRQSVRRLVPFAAYAHKSRISRELMKIVVEKFLPLRTDGPRDVRALSREAGRVLKSCGAKLVENRGASPVTPDLELWSQKAG